MMKILRTGSRGERERKGRKQVPTRHGSWFHAHVCAYGCTANNVLGSCCAIKFLLEAWKDNRKSGKGLAT